jgi:radical SAM-linked protein
MEELVQIRRSRPAPEAATPEAAAPEAATPEAAAPEAPPREAPALARGPASARAGQGPDVCDVSLPRAARTRFRVRLAKRGRAALLSHLETFDAILRALRRREVPTIFSLAIHARPRASMSPPIPLGATSEAELFDVEVKRPYSTLELTRALDGNLPDGLVVLSVAEIPVDAPAASASIERMTWRLAPPPGAPLPEALGSFGAPPPSRRGKRGGPRARRSLDTAAILHAAARADGAWTLELDTRQGGRLREVFHALFGFDPLDHGWAVTKLDVVLGTGVALGAEASAPDDVPRAADGDEPTEAPAPAWAEGTAEAELGVG